MFALLFLACFENDIDTATPLLEEEYQPVIAKVSWKSTNLILEITGPQDQVGNDYSFGIIESKGADAPCEENLYGCWTGEDCSGIPFESANNRPIPNKCHRTIEDTSANGENPENKTHKATLEYSQVGIDYYISNPENSEGGSENSTAFPKPSMEQYEFRVTYFLKDEYSGKCWAWGINPDYFSDRNCDYPARDQEFSAGSHVLILE